MSPTRIRSSFNKSSQNNKNKNKIKIAHDEQFKFNYFKISQFDVVTI